MIGSFGNKKIVNIASKQIIEKKLSPCIYLQEVTSVSQNRKGKETIGIIKTNQKNVSKILKIIHKHKVPEFSVLQATDEWKPYLNFLENYPPQ